MDVHRYRAGEADWLLLNWLSVLRTSGEIEHTLSKGVNSPSAFLSFFQYRPMVYTTTSLGNVDRAAWIEPSMGSVFLGFWLAEDKRYYNKDSLVFLCDVIDQCFVEGANSLAGVIKERATPEITDAFIRQHERLGYSYCGRLPNWFDGENAHIVAMSAVEWENFNGRAKHAWRRWREGATTNGVGWRQGQSRSHHTGDTTGTDLPGLNGSAVGELGTGGDLDAASGWWGEFAEYAYAFTD